MSAAVVQRLDGETKLYRVRSCFDTCLNVYVGIWVNDILYDILYGIL